MGRVKREENVKTEDRLGSDPIIQIEVLGHV